jgi:hypothetical protein
MQKFSCNHPLPLLEKEGNFARHIIGKYRQSGSSASFLPPGLKAAKVHVVHKILLFVLREFFVSS